MKSFLHHACNTLRENLPLVIVLALGAVLLFSLVGCASYNTVHQNAAGQQVRCATSGWGWIGAPYAAHMHDKCVEDATARGYK